MDEHFNVIIKDSELKIQALKDITNFFNQADLYSVLVRTKVIHKLFENNPNLDINKLELFHIQYTSSLIELFQKLKKAKEQQYLAIRDEIAINEDFCLKLDQQAESTDFFDLSKTHALHMAAKIEQFYGVLTYEKSDDFSWTELLIFPNTFKNEYFRSISETQYKNLLTCSSKTYQHKIANIEVRLLGRLNRFNYKIKFVCGLIWRDEVIEIFKFRDTNDLFLFDTNQKLFYFLTPEKIQLVDLSRNVSNRNRVLAELRSKTLSLKHQLETVKTTLTSEVFEVLQNYLQKITDVDFIDDLQNVDEQTNILRSMLNINIK